MMREIILNEIKRRLAAENGGAPPGPGLFSRVTGITPAKWTPAMNLWATLDRVREDVADLLAASWAEQRKVPQVAFGLDRRRGQRAGFCRNEQMQSLNPRYVVAFAGSGVVERLVIQPKQKRIAVVDRRGPLGTNPMHAARTSGAPD